MRNVKAVVVFCIVASLALPCSATLVDLTASGLGLQEGNQGPTLFIDNVLQISALTRITAQGSETGSVYLYATDGLGVQTFSGGGSKEISGGGKDQDEALILDFIGGVVAGSVSLGLNKYAASDDDPVITMTFADGSESQFDQSHQNWSSAVTNLGGDKINIDMGVLLGNNSYLAANRLTIMEPTGHITVNSAAYEIPEPATMALLCMGSLILTRQRRLKGI